MSSAAAAGVPPPHDGITPAPDSPNGYRRPPALQAQFEQAAAALLANDAWTPPGGGSPKLMADLALEGGGVKGIGIVGAVLVLAEAGYHFERVAGTSAGAIAASLIAAISKHDGDMAQLKTHMDTMQFKKFMRGGILRPAFRALGKWGEPGEIAADLGVLTHRRGIYSSQYLDDWLRPILAGLEVSTFKDLHIDDDPGTDLPPNRSFRLLVHTSDITRKELVRLPWDFEYYGATAEQQDVVDAVRASMSIPFFFTPMTFPATATKVKVPVAGGGDIDVEYGGGTVTWVDGGLLRNFPIDAFERTDGAAPRWPTIGVKLSSLEQKFGPTEATRTSYGEVANVIRTLINEWDAYSVEPATAARTIFVDTDGLTAIDFDLTPDQTESLFLNGVAAATDFVIRMGNYKSVPKNDAQAMVMLRQQNGELAVRIPLRYRG